MFRIDNMATVYGWEKGRVNLDGSATEILKCVSYMAAFLGVTVYVEQVGRMSCHMAEMADELSRRKMPSGEEVKKVLAGKEVRPVEGKLLKWLEDPKEMGDCLER